MQTQTEQEHSCIEMALVKVTRGKRSHDDEPLTASKRVQLSEESHRANLEATCKLAMKRLESAWVVAPPNSAGVIKCLKDERVVHTIQTCKQLATETHKFLRSFAEMGKSSQFETFLEGFKLSMETYNSA
jgi:hypothetical protein